MPWWHMQVDRGWTLVNRYLLDNDRLRIKHLRLRREIPDVDLAVEPRLADGHGDACICRIDLTCGEKCHCSE